MPRNQTAMVALRLRSMVEEHTAEGIALNTLIQSVVLRSACSSASLSPPPF